MTTPRILLVDDQRQVSRMLRSSLELSGHEYAIVDVSSAEEALQELEREQVDMLVTDLRLPGMSGLELLEKARNLNSQIKAIIITGQPSEEARRKAESLGVVAFLRKPLGTNFFIQAVENALGTSPASRPLVMLKEEDKARMAPSLAGLKRQIGAQAVLLLNDEGTVILEDGELEDFNRSLVLPDIMKAFCAGLQIAGTLGSLLPRNLQYFDGDKYELYVTNIGAYFAMLMIFPSGQEPGQMGAVVHYARKTAQDLLEALSQLGEGEGGGAMAKLGKQEKAEPTERAPNDGVGQEIDLESAEGGVERQQAERFWDEAVTQSGGKTAPEGDALTYDQAKELGLLSDESD
jgi:CheY-like chemotaxis protein